MPDARPAPIPNKPTSALSLKKAMKYESVLLSNQYAMAAGIKGTAYFSITVKRCLLKYFVLNQPCICCKATRLNIADEIANAANTPVICQRKTITNKTERPMVTID